MNIKINLISLIKPFFLHDQKVKAKIKVSWERKELLRRNKKHFSSFSKVKQFFLEGESPRVSVCFTVRSNKKCIVNESFPHPRFCRLCLKKFSFNVVHKNTSIWGEGGRDLVPIAIPDICWKNLKLNSKKMFFGTKSACRFCDIFYVYLLMQKLVLLIAKNL